MALSSRAADYVNREILGARNVRTAADEIESEVHQ